MRLGRASWVLLLVLAGCVLPAQWPRTSTPPDERNAAEAPVWTSDINALPRDLLASKPVRDGDGFLLMGHVHRQRDGLTHPVVLRLGADGGVAEAATLGSPFYGEWIQARKKGTVVEMIGFQSEWGMCCATYNPDGSHGDGYFVRYRPFVETWTLDAAGTQRTSLACDERGAFSVLEVDGTWYIVGGATSYSTGSAARFDARKILQLDAGSDACQDTGLVLPEPTLRPMVLQVGDEVHVFSREDGGAWMFRPSENEVRNSTFVLPTFLDYGYATIANTPGAAYILGASTLLENESRIVRLDLGAATTRIQKEAFMDRGWEVAAVWTGSRILILGGVDYTEHGDWHLSRSVTSYRPSGEAASQIPPVPVINAQVENLTVIVDGAGSRDPDGFIASWYWRFLGVEHCFSNYDDCYYAEGPMARHRYAAGGRYVVELTVSDNLGLASTVQTEVVVPS